MSGHYSAAQRRRRHGVCSPVDGRVSECGDCLPPSPPIPTRSPSHGPETRRAPRAAVFELPRRRGVTRRPSRWWWLWAGEPRVHRRDIPARANLSPLVLTGSTLEKTRGGRASPDPSHLDEEAEKISAEDKMRAQATRWGREVRRRGRRGRGRGRRGRGRRGRGRDVHARRHLPRRRRRGQMPRSAILVGSSVSDACAGRAGRAPASGGVFATDPTAVDERSAGLAAAVDAERWIRSGGGFRR